MEINRFTLSNGLRVIHNLDTSTAMVAVNVVYNVGARDESPELTGLAHLFEHLMFGGSVNVPDFDGEIEKAGGTNNAWTSNDYTSFYDLMPAHNVETAFWVESDRMLSLAFSQYALEVQQGVVIEEFKQQCLNQPYGDASHHLRRMLYKVHPYRWPVIGVEPDHIARVTLDDVERFFFSHYAPNNAILVVGGNVSLERTRELAEKWFGDIPRREVAPRDYPQEPLSSDTQMVTVKGNVPQTMITVAYPMPEYDNPLYIACDTLTDVLAAGRASRLYRNLLMGTDSFNSIDASIVGSDEPGYLMVNARLTDNSEASVKRALDLIDGALQELVDNPIGDRELERVLNRFETTFSFGSIDYFSRTQSIASREIHNEDINGVVARYRDLTPEQLQRTAKQIFVPSRSSTLIYYPD